MKPIEIKNFLNIDECDTIIKMSSNIEFVNATTNYKNKKNINNENLNFNKRKIKYLDTESIDGLSNKIFNKLNELNIFKGITYDTIPYYSFNKYSVNDFLNYHYDGAEIENGATITLILELSDDFVGGEVCYIIDGIEYQFTKGKGNLYIFDSNTMHKINEITNGVRYSINCWPRGTHNKTLF